MGLMQQFQNFLNCIFFWFRKKAEDSSDGEKLLVEEIPQGNTELELSNEKPTIINDAKLDVARRTVLTELYILEQKILVFRDEFPEQYKVFWKKIQMLREIYKSDLEEIKKELTFSIDPELDSRTTGEVSKLKNDIEKFIEKEVKFSIFCKRFERLVKKLNILYNTSIFHFRETDKQKVVCQLENALESAKKLVCELKACEYILSDRQLKERIVSLISYVDYQIFKIAIRNANNAPLELSENLLMVKEFNNFNYVIPFEAFIKDEMYSLNNLQKWISDVEYRKIFEKKSKDILTELTYNSEELILNSGFWDKILDFESTLFETLSMEGKLPKEEIKVELIGRMDIKVEDNDVIVLPKTNACLAFTSIYSATHDNRIFLIIKLLKNLSNEITYKEIYFLTLLFDAIELVKTVPNELIKQLQKYIEKYPYDRRTILNRKENVIKSLNDEENVLLFTVENYEEEIIKTLEELNLDIEVINNNVYINSFYFNGLDNVIETLKKNMMI